MTEARVKVGVIGVGHLGSTHARLYADVAAVQLIGLYDVDEGRAGVLSQDLKVRGFSGLGEILREVDAVSIVTPTSTHFEIARQAIRAGKHVFIEKPITSTTAEARELTREARERGVKVQVGHIERFNPALLALEPYHLAPMFIESHRMAQFNPRGTDVAVVLDLMIHDIDIILSLVRAPVEDIRASGVAVVSDTIDIANARIQFKNGCVANVTASRISQKKMRKMRMFQRDAYIAVDFSEGSAEVFQLADPVAEVPEGCMPLGEIGIGEKRRSIVYGQPLIREVNALRHELELFARCIREDSEPVVTGEEATQALEVAQQIMQEIRRQKLTV